MLERNPNSIGPEHSLVSLVELVEPILEDVQISELILLLKACRQEKENYSSKFLHRLYLLYSSVLTDDLFATLPIE